MFPEEGPHAGQGVVERMAVIGQHITHAEETVAARPALASEAGRLHIRPGAIVLTIARIYRTSERGRGNRRHHHPGGAVRARLRHTSPLSPAASTGLRCPAPGGASGPAGVFHGPWAVLGGAVLTGLAAAGYVPLIRDGVLRRRGELEAQEQADQQRPDDKLRSILKVSNDEDRAQRGKPYRLEIFF